jgi:glycosyltransferase involved in cell wall biosynthesis
MVAAELAKLCQSCRFVVIGEGQKRKEYERMARDRHVDVMFLGERLDVPVLLSIFDLFLFTSKWEPFGIVLLEAMAAAVPVVGYSVPGMQEIANRGGAVLIQERAPQILARTAMGILSDRKQYVELQRAGLANVRANFDVRKRILELESLYVKLLSAT